MWVSQRHRVRCGIETHAHSTVGNALQLLVMLFYHQHWQHAATVGIYCVVKSENALLVTHAPTSGPATSMWFATKPG